MSVRPLAWIGLVSYGVYMWHVPLLLFARRIDVLPARLSRCASLLLLVPVLLVAAASWYLVERPLIAWAGRPRTSRAERAGAGAASRARGTARGAARRARRAGTASARRHPTPGRP